MAKKYLPIANNGNDSKELDKGEDIPDDKVVLSRFLGLIQSISFVLGLIIGTGIFLTPTGVIRGSSGSIGVSLIMWVVGAFTSATGAMCVTELALYYRQSGGSYVFLRSVYGPALGFLKMWVYFFVLAPCSSAIQSITIVNFLVTPFVGECGSVPEAGIKMGASCVIRLKYCMSKVFKLILTVLAVVINSVSTRWTAKVQVVLLFIKTGAVMAIIIMGAVKLIKEGSSNFEKPFQTSGEFDVSKLPSAFFSASFAYGGWNSISNITEEVKKPAKTMVRAMIISFVCVTILYLLTNVAYFAVLTPEEMMSSNAVAALFAVRVIGKRWSFIIWMCVVCSAAGNLIGSTYIRSRVYFVTARDGQFPFILSTIHITRKTPLAAIIISVPITVLVIWSGNVWSVIDFLVCFDQIMNILTMVTVPYLRWKIPERKLSFKAPLWSSFVYIGFTLAVVLMSAYANPLQLGITAAIICTALIFYWLNQLLNRSDRAQEKMKHVNDFLQKLLFSVEQEMKTY